MLRLLFRHLLMCLLLLGGAVAARSNPIPGLHDTGVDGAGVVLPVGSAEQHYVLTGPSSAPFVIVPLYTWIQAPSGSAWIGPTDGSVTDPPGQYVYTMSFSLLGLDPVSAIISGNWASDNGAVIRLNGVDTGNQNGSGRVPFESLHSFSITFGFVAGLNVLEFVVTNEPPGGLNPTGLLVANISGHADPPIGIEPCTWGKAKRMYGVPSR